MVFTIKRGDTSPNMVFNLTDSDGDEVDISGYNRVEFHMRDKTDKKLIVDENVPGNVEVIDAATGEVEYDWQPGDTGKSGEYEVELEVEFGDGKIETFPNDGFVIVEVTDDIK